MSECFKLPDSDFVVYSDCPAFEVKGRKWFDSSLMDQDQLLQSIFQHSPEGHKTDPTCVFLLCPKACGKSTFLKKHQKFLRSNLRLDKKHCRVDYDLLRDSHLGYKSLISDGLRKKRVYAGASKILKKQFPRWKLEKAFELVKNKFDLVVADNGGKKIGQIVCTGGIKDYNVHLVVIFVSLKMSLSRQCFRATQQGRSVKDIRYNLQKYGNLMRNMRSTMLKTTGNIVIVNNEEFKCEIKGVFTLQEAEKAFQCVKDLHVKNNGFNLDLWTKENCNTLIENQYVPKRYRSFGH